MSFLDDLIRYGAPVVGGVGGGLAGFFGGGMNPLTALEGASIGAGLGGKVGSILTSGEDAGADELDRRAAAWDPMQNPEYATQIAKLKQYGEGKVLPEDKERQAQALDVANEFAHGQTGSIEQRARAHGGGPNVGLEAALEAEGASAGSQRLSRATSATAAMASERGREANLELLHQLGTLSTMQQQFALLKSGMAGSQQSAKNANANALYGDLANFGVGAMMKAKGGSPNVAPPVAAGKAPQPVADPSAGSWDPAGDLDVYGNRLSYNGGEYQTPDNGKGFTDYLSEGASVPGQRKVQIPKFSTVTYGR